MARITKALVPATCIVIAAAVSLIYHVVAADESSLKVRLCAPWRSSSVLEQAEYLSLSSSPGLQSRFWEFVDAEDKSQFALSTVEARQQKLSLSIGEYAARVEAHTRLSEKLRKALDFTMCVGESWAAVGTPEGVFATCDPKDLAALRTDSDSCSAISSSVSLAKTEIDHVLRSQPANTKRIIVHGDLESASFFKMWQAASRLSPDDVDIVLRLEASTHKGNATRPCFGGFSVSLDIKNTEYVAVDRTFKKDSGDDGSLESGIYFSTLLEQFASDAEMQTKLNALRANLKAGREKLKAWELGDVSIQMAIDALSSDDPLSRLGDTTQGLPSHARRLVKLVVPDETREILRKRPQLDTQVSVNGLTIDLSSDFTTIVQQLRRLARIGEQASITRIDKAEFDDWIQKQNKGKLDWGARVDVRRFAKGAVNFLNDLEKDSVYASLPRSLSALKSRGGMQLVPLARNLYTCIVIIDPADPAHLDVLGVMRYLIRAGAPIRFGLALTSKELSEKYAHETGKDIPIDDMGMCDDQTCGSTKCLIRLYATARKEHGTDTAVAFLADLHSQNEIITRCEGLVNAYAKIVARETGSWSSTKFKKEAEVALLGRNAELVQDHEMTVRRMARYVGALGLAVPSVTFNGIVLELSKNVRLDRLIQPVLFQEQSLLKEASDLLVDAEDVLGQVMRLSRATTRNSRLVNVPLEEMVFIVPPQPMESPDNSSSPGSTDLGNTKTPTKSYEQPLYIHDPSTSGGVVKATVWVFVGTPEGCQAGLAALAALKDREDVRLGFYPFAASINERDNEAETAWRELKTNPSNALTQCSLGLSRPSSLSPYPLKLNAPAGTTLVVNGRALVSTPGTETRVESSDILAMLQQELDRAAGAIQAGLSPDQLIVASALMGVWVQALESAGSAGGGSMNVLKSKGIDPVNDEFTWSSATANDKKHWVGFEVQLIADPLSSLTPKAVAFAQWMRKEWNARVTMSIFPRESIAALPPSSFHCWALVGSCVFKDLPPDQLLTLKVHTPQSWIAYPGDLGKRDPDNLLMSEGSLVAEYDVAHVLIDGHAMTEETGEPAAGMQMELVDFDGLSRVGDHSPPRVADSIVMYNLGYWQMKARPGLFRLRPLKGHVLTSVENNELLVGFTEFAGSGPIELTVRKDEHAALIAKMDEDLTFSNDDDTMHVFSLASGALYERFLRIMMLSVRKRSSGKIKFWLLENYMSAQMKAFMPSYAKRNNFEYELVTFKWPDWLRGQSERQRQIWGMKILFLDVLFPLNVKRIIYVDSDQVLRSDLRELWRLDLKGAPYGMTPFCDSRKETLGFQFWRHGYWESHLRGKSYHISALFVVDLVTFRRDSVGDRLRATYQQLSSDPNSLSNLDQDLPNFAQHEIPIYSLPLEWLWCESWCSDASKAKAKTIDLCNNPLHKEPKLEMAKRVIKGDLFKESWEDLDREVGWTS